MFKRLVVISLLIFVGMLGLLACRAPEDIARDYVKTRIAGPRQTAEAYLATAQASGVVGAVETAAAALQTVVAGEGDPIPVESTPLPINTIQPIGTPTPVVTYGPDARPNLSIVSVEPVQVVEGAPLVLNKATAVKVVVRKTGPFALSNVEVVVFEDGVPYYEFFVYDDANLADPNLDPRLLASNLNAHDGQAPFPLNFEHGDSEKIVYFFADGFAPESIGPGYDVSAQVDMSIADAQLYEEENIVDNQLTSEKFEVVDTFWWNEDQPSDWRTDYDWVVQIVFVDFEEGPFNYQEVCDEIEEYLLGVMPIAKYRWLNDGTRVEKFEVRCDPSYRSSEPFAGDDGKFAGGNIEKLANSVSSAFWTTDPVIDNFIVVLPKNWFRENGKKGLILNTTDYANVSGTIVGQLGIIELHRNDIEGDSKIHGTYRAIAAHEVGHIFNLYTNRKYTANGYYPCEAYFQNCDENDQIIGEFASPSIWYIERLVIPDPIKDSDSHTTNSNFYHYMGSGNKAWTNIQDYTHILNMHR